MPGDPIHSLLRFQQAEGEPSSPLFGVMPAFDVTDVLLNKAVQILDCIGRFQAPSHLLEDPETMERQRLFEAFLEGPSC